MPTVAGHTTSAWPSRPHLGAQLRAVSLAPFPGARDSDTTYFHPGTCRGTVLACILWDVFRASVLLTT